MSCGCGTSTTGNAGCTHVDPCICGPVPTTPAFVAGPPGANGKSAYELWLEAGNVGSEAEFLASLAGEQGQAGEQGPTGPRGAPGTISGSPGRDGLTTPVAFFTGARFSVSPIDGACDALDAIPFNRVLHLGQVPCVSGRYLARVSLQVGWTGSRVADLNGNAWMFQSQYDYAPFGASTELVSWDWARLRRGSGTLNYGTLQSLDLEVIVDLIQGYYLRIEAGADFYLAGGSLTLFAAPQYIVASPGFADGLYQRTFTP